MQASTSRLSTKWNLFAVPRSLSGLKLLPVAGELLPLTIERALHSCLPSSSGVQQALAEPASNEQAGQ